jgi:antitoxin YefM
MYATYHLNADELNADMLQSLKKAYQHEEIVILPKGEYDEMEKARHNAVFTEKLQHRIKRLDEGKGITVTMAELDAMAEEPPDSAFTEKLQRRLKELEEGKITVKTLAELRALANE